MCLGLNLMPVLTITSVLWLWGWNSGDMNSTPLYSWKAWEEKLRQVAQASARGSRQARTIAQTKTDQQA